MDVVGVGFYLAIALVTHLAFRSRPGWLIVALALLFGATAVGLVALISTHQFDFFSHQNIAELPAGNALAAILSFGVGAVVRRVRRRARR